MFGFAISPSIGRHHATFDANALLYFSTLPTSLSASRKTLINDLFVGLKADGNFTKIDRLWLFANEVQNQAPISLINPTSTAVSEVNSPSWTADRGYTPDGITKYLNTNYVPSVDGVNFTLNSASMSVYSRTDTNSGITFGGGVIGAESDHMAPRFGGQFYILVNQNSADNVAVSDSLGFFTARRTAVGVDSSRINGVQNATYTTTSTGLGAYSLFIGGYNSSGSFVAPDDKQISCAVLGSGDIDDTALYSRIQTYMTAIGANV